MKVGSSVDADMRAGTGFFDSERADDHGGVDAHARPDLGAEVTGEPAFVDSHQVGASEGPDNHAFAVFHY